MAYSKGNCDGPNGVHGVPVWRIAGYALNNCATNVYAFVMMYVAYYLTGFVGMGVVLAGSFSMIMRLWDGVTDPFIGLVLDKTNGKFGKNRPFLVIGNAILLVTSFILFHVTHLLPEFARIPFFFVMAALYYIGYTCQCVVTKSAQSCITNDPKQRPLFAVFDGIFGAALFAGIQIMVGSYLVPKYGAMAELGVFHELWVFAAIFSAVATTIAVISIAPKDNSKYFGTGTTVKVGFKDYVDVLCHNRAMQMLVLSASTDKIATSTKTSTVTVIMYGIVAGNFALSGVFSAYTTVFKVAFLFIGVGIIATRLGQRRAMIVGSVGSMVANVLLILLWVMGDPTTLSLPGDGRFVSFNFLSLALLTLTVVADGFSGIASSIVIPMTADVADYETYRTGKYVPGLIGTMFSFVDKIVSSVAPMITSMLLAVIGYTTVMPDVNTPYSPELKTVGLICMYGIVIFGLTCNIIAMKFYPLTKEKMQDIQTEIAAIKAKSAAQAVTT